MSESLTPMMRQYQSIRRGLPANTLLLFRLGDFYEMFFDDAKEAAAILNVALTKRNGVPMCGIPHHAAEGYIAKLIKAGKRAAIGDQIGEAQPGKLVARELTRIITPGTVGDENLLDAKRGHYLAAVHSLKGRFGFALVDLSTGEFRVTELDSASAVRDEIARATPAEILISDEDRESAALLPDATAHDGFAFLHDHAYFALRDHFKVQSLDGFGCGEMPAAIGAAGAVLHYLEQQLRRKTDHITTLQTYRTGHFVELGEATQEHLELVSSRGARNTSLLGSLDRTVTPMGGRRLRAWILHPLRDRAELERRQDAIASFLEDAARLNEIRETLGAVRDIERTSGRLGQASGNGRDLAALRVSLETIPAVKALLRAPVGSPDLVGESPDAPALLMELACAMGDFPELVETLASALVGEPPATIKDGGIFRDGYDAALDELRAASPEGKQWIAELQEREIERTGIKSLKIRYNTVFGYFIEITKSNLASVPEDYIRKQTMVNAERFITPELKEIEDKILGADERARQLENRTFHRTARARAGAPRRPPAHRRRRGRRSTSWPPRRNRAPLQLLPPVLDDDRAAVHQGRSPSGARPESRRREVRAQRRPARPERTAPPHHHRPEHGRQIHLHPPGRPARAHGPDGQRSCPRPAREIGLVDRIFTRVGASDDLVARPVDVHGRDERDRQHRQQRHRAQPGHPRRDRTRHLAPSTASPSRGASPSTCTTRIRARTLFATHYHELTDAREAPAPGVKNYNVAVREWNDQIIFLRKIVARRRRQELRHPGRPPRRPAAVAHRPRPRDSRKSRESRTQCRRPACARGGCPAFAAPAPGGRRAGGTAPAAYPVLSPSSHARACSRVANFPSNCRVLGCREDFLEHRTGFHSTVNEVPPGDERRRDERFAGEFFAFAFEILQIVEQSVAALAIHTVQLEFLLEPWPGHESLERRHPHIFHILESHVPVHHLHDGLRLRPGKFEALHHLLRHARSDAVVSVEPDPPVFIHRPAGWFADVVQQGRPHQRVGRIRIQQVEHDAGVDEHIALGMKFRRLLAALERRDFGQQLRQQPAAIQKIEPPRTVPHAQQPHELLADPLGTHPPDPVHSGTQRLPCPRFDPKSQHRREPHRPQQAQTVLPEPVDRIANGPQHPRFQIFAAPDIIQDLAGDRVFEKAVHGKIPAARILFGRREAHTLRMPSVPISSIAAEGGHLEDPAFFDHTDDPEMSPHFEGARKQRAHRVRRGGGGDIIIRRNHSSQFVPHTPAGVQRNMTGLLQAADDISGDGFHTPHCAHAAGPDQSKTRSHCPPLSPVP